MGYERESFARRNSVGTLLVTLGLISDRARASNVEEAETTTNFKSCSGRNRRSHEKFSCRRFPSFFRGALVANVCHTASCSVVNQEHVKLPVWRILSPTGVKGGCPPFCLTALDTRFTQRCGKPAVKPKQARPSRIQPGSTHCPVPCRS